MATNQELARIVNCIWSGDSAAFSDLSAAILGAGAVILSNHHYIQ